MTTYDAPDADAMKALGRDVVGPLLGAGDLVILTGDLGAGKTTFTQGLGRAMGVEGTITSPTFVLARTHPSLDDGPGLVHVDAYRLGGPEEIDDLDLDASAEESVTVVEWGAGLAEQLSDSWLSVAIEVREARPIDPLGTKADGTHGTVAEELDAEPRVVTVKPHGPRWVDVPLRSTLLS